MKSSPKTLFRYPRRHSGVTALRAACGVVFALLPGFALPTVAASGTPPPETALSGLAAPSPSPGTNSPSPSPAVLPRSTESVPTDPGMPPLAAREIPEIHGSISLPKDWSLVMGKLLEGGVLIASREKIASENDSWTTGLTLTVDSNGAGESGQPVGDYALGLAREAREKIGDDATEISETRHDKVREFRFEYPLPGDVPLRVTEVLRADEANGVMTVILWQAPSGETDRIKPLREAILSSIRS